MTELSLLAANSWMLLGIRRMYSLLERIFDRSAHLPTISMARHMMNWTHLHRRRWCRRPRLRHHQYQHHVRWKKELNHGIFLFHIRSVSTSVLCAQACAHWNWSDDVISKVCLYIGHSRESRTCAQWNHIDYMHDWGNSQLGTKSVLLIGHSSRSRTSAQWNRYLRSTWLATRPNGSYKETHIQARWASLLIILSW